MRIARVIGIVTLNQRMPDLPAARYLLVRTLGRSALTGKDAGNDETLVTYDDLGAREGDRIGLVEGREAAAPFHPAKVPYDCYDAAILDEVWFEPCLETEFDAQPHRTRDRKT